MESARAQALRLLKFRPRTEAELRDRLIRKGCRAEEIEAVLAEFRRNGWVDDAKFARLFVAQKALSKPLGRRMLLSKLQEKGIAPELAQAAVSADGGPDEFETARRLATQRVERMKDLDRAAVDRRLFGFLSRRGFSSGVIYKVIRELRDTVHSPAGSP